MCKYARRNQNEICNCEKWLALLLAACMVMALAACGKTADDTGTTGGDTGDTGDTGSSAAKIAVVFASSGLGDKSFNDALFNGMKDAESTMGIEWVYSEPKDDAEYEGLISGYADSGDCDLIICLGGSQSSSLENVAPNYPQQKFVILDAVVEGDNIRSYTWRDQELGFLAGFLGTSLSETHKLGFIGAHDIPPVQPGRCRHDRRRPLRGPHLRGAGGLRQRLGRGQRLL